MNVVLISFAKLKFTPLEFKTNLFTNQKKRANKLKFTPLEFKTNDR